MITIKLEELINCAEGLKNLSQKQLKARTAYTVGKLLKVADAEMNEFNEARMKLIKKYGEKDENNELITDENENVHIPNESVEAFNSELQDLLSASIELNANKIKLDDLDDVDFTPSEMTQLDPFIESDE